MMAPASPRIAEQFGITNSTVIALLTSTYVLAYGMSYQAFLYSTRSPPSSHGAVFGPLVLGPISELYGRARVLQAGNFWYLGALVSWNDRIELT